MALRRPSSSLLARVLSASATSASSPSTSSCPSFRSLSSSSPSSAAPVSQKPMVKIKAVRVIQGTGKQTPRKKGSTYRVDKSAVPEMSTEPISFDHLPKYTPNNVTPDSVGKLHLVDTETRANVFQWGAPTSQSEGTVPFSVPRDLTIDLVSRLEKVKNEAIEDPKTHRHANLLLWGSSGSGKSHLVVQSLYHAIQSGWITIYIEDAFRHTKNHYAFHYSPHTKTFHQPTLASEMLRKLSKSGSKNASLLSQIPLPSESYIFTPDVAPGIGGVRKPVDVVFERITGVGRQVRNAEGQLETSSGYKRSLRDLAELGANTPAISSAVLETVMEILSKQDRIPVLMAFDHIQAYFRPSKYLTPELNVLEPYHLSVPRLLLEFISGRKQLARGAIISTISPLNVNCRISPSFLHGLSLPTHAYPLGSYLTFNKKMYPQNPHEEISEWHSVNAREMERIEVPEGMSLEEARGLWEVKVVRRRLHSVNSDDNYMAKWTEVAGNPRAFFRGIDLSLA